MTVAHLMFQVFLQCVLPSIDIYIKARCLKATGYLFYSHHRRPSCHRQADVIEWTAQTQILLSRWNLNGFRNGLVSYKRY